MCDNADESRKVYASLCKKDLLCLAAGVRWIAGETKLLHWAA